MDERTRKRIAQLNKETVDLVPYDPAWVGRYEEVEAELKTLVPRMIMLRIAHIGSTAVPGLSAKPVIDVQVDFAAPEGAMARSGADMKPVQAALGRIAELVDAARIAGVPCIFTRAVTAPERQTAIEAEGRARHGDATPNMCLAGSHGVEFVEPRPREGELVITKQRYSVFPGTGLAETLKARGVDSVIGGEAEAPLLALADALDRGEEGRLPGVGRPGRPGAPHLARLDFPVPSRAALPSIKKYAHLERDGRMELVAYTETTRGCLHRCRHCPIPPVYGGRFFAVPRDVVLADVRQQVEAGARHVTFGDPDFLNGPTHALAVARGALIHEARA